MSIKNNKNICLVYIYGNIRRQYYIIICMCFTAETIILLATYVLNVINQIVYWIIIELCCPQQLGKLF